jgi:aryl-alcohol dehydrogenase-like predicted oxidoreductase
VRFGGQPDPGGAWIGYDARPAVLKSAAGYSLQRLDTDYIDVYRPAIAWVGSRGADVVPLVGARARTRLTEALGAVDVTLTDGQLAQIEAAVRADEVVGDRYPSAHMAALDSERSAVCPGGSSRLSTWAVARRPGPYTVKV